MDLARYSLFLWGASLPFISFSSEKGADAVTVAERFAAADFFGLLVILFSLPAGRWLRPSKYYPSATAGPLLFLAGVSTFLAVMFIPPAQSPLKYILPFLIFGFLTLLSARACTVLRNERDLVIFASFIALGGFIESLIVGHDLAARLVGASMWFRDSMDLRARGTFRASGMLAQYGFVVGGVLFALAAWPNVKAKTRLWWTLTSVSLLMYPIFTTRRSGIGALVVLLAVWITLNQMHGLQGLKKAAPVLAPIVLIMIAYMMQAEYRDFLLGRVNSAHVRVEEGHGFLYQQLYDAEQSLPKHPLFGVGWGLSTSTSRTENEMHSTYLAVLVDSGLAGFLAFAALIGNLLYQCWRLIKMTKRTPYLEFSIRLFALMTAQLVFWAHNRGLRDRGFFLFLAVFASGAHCIRTALKKEAVPAAAA